MFAAFRNKVHVHEKSERIEWNGGFPSVLKLWEDVAPTLVLHTKEATKQYGHKPDAIGKSRSHWLNMHQTVELHMLRKKALQG